MVRKFKNYFHLLVAIVSNIIYGFPGKRMRVIGVTGTDGKTTTVSLIYHILKLSGAKVSMLNSVGAYIGDKKYDTGFHVTTPSPFELQKFLKKALDSGSEYFVLEVTSHALDQYRAWGINFEIGVITNVTNEHLDYHKTYDNYVRIKSKLLKSAKVAIINVDDGSYGRLKEHISKAKGEIVTYGFSDKAQINLNKFNFNSDVLSDNFNKYNALAAIACTQKLNVSWENIKKSLLSFQLPTGRMDCVYDNDFKVIIDFAHTPNAFEQLLSSIRLNSTGKLIHVFGSAGERDRSKRPVMGKISSKYSDVMIVTSEDPRTESADKIIEEIVSEVNSNKVEVVKISDRKNAIAYGIKIAKKNDVLVITGKAHEKSMTYGKKDTPWDEYAVVKKALSFRINNEK